MIDFNADDMRDLLAAPASELQSVERKILRAALDGSPTVTVTLCDTTLIAHFQAAGFTVENCGDTAIISW